jgi:hypothetical protein
MAWIIIEDLHQLEKGAGPLRVQRQAALVLAAASRQRIRAERGGVPLPDSIDVLTRLREGRVDELASMR